MPFSGIHCYPSMTSTVRTWAFLGGIQSFATTAPEREWGIAIDNWDASMITLEAAEVPRTTIVSNHPMMLTGNEVVATNINEVPMPSSGTPERMFASMYRFGNLRVFKTVSAIDLTHLRHSDVEYTRHYGPLAASATLAPWLDPVQEDPYSQMAVIGDRVGEDNQYRYRLDWMSAGAQVTPPNPTHVQLSGLRAGESAIIGLARYAFPAILSTLVIQRAIQVDPNGHPTFGTQITVRTTGTLPAPGSPTEAWADTATGVLWLRITIPALPTFNVVNGQGDGVGQALRISW